MKPTPHAPPETFLCRVHRAAEERARPRQWAWSPAPEGLACAEGDCWRRADARGVARSWGLMLARARSQRYALRHRGEILVRAAQHRAAHRSEIRAKARQHRSTHRAAVNAYAREWQRAHRASHAAAMRRWRASHQAQHQAYRRQWEAANRTRRNAQARARRAARKGVA